VEHGLAEVTRLFGPSSPWWILYSLATLAAGVALQVAVGGRAGLILVAGGVVGLAVNGRRLIR
jgi:hypothetical protein